jgi:hypothetical protein
MLLDGKGIYRYMLLLSIFHQLHTSEFFSSSLTHESAVLIIANGQGITFLAGFERLGAGS